MSDIHLRFYQAKDRRQVMDMEQLCFVHPWDDAILAHALRQRNVIAMVATDDPSDSHIVGSMIYELHKAHIEIISIGVMPSYQRSGIGRTMVDKLKSKLSLKRRHRLYADVWEMNLDGQLFFQAMGFKAVRIRENCYADPPNMNAYRFAFRLTSNCPVVNIPQRETT